MTDSGTDRDPDPEVGSDPRASPGTRESLARSGPEPATRGRPRPASPEAVPRLHLITDDAILARPDFMAVGHALVAAGGSDVALHVRGPSTDGRTLYRRTLGLRGPTRDSGVVLVVNDRVDVAVAADADAVQLGGRSLPVQRLPEASSALRVGVSVHTIEAASAADDADWLLVGTIYATPSHPERPGAGPAFLGAVAAVTTRPTIAIGGVSPERVGEVVRAGARGVAVMRGVWDASDPIEALHRYLEAVRLDPTPDSTPTP